MTNYLPAVVGQLLTGYGMKQNDARQERGHGANAAAKAWNTFNKRSGSLAVEHSTL